MLPRWRRTTCPFLKRNLKRFIGGMSKLPRVSGGDVAKALGKAGFSFVRQRVATFSLPPLRGNGQDPLQKPVLRSGHLFLAGVRGVIVAGEMQQAVQRVEQNLVLHIKAVRHRMILRDGRADQNFAVGKGDDIRLGRIAEKIAMDADHGGAIDEHEFNRGQIDRQRPWKKRERRIKPPPKPTDLYRNFALLV
jgi:hypothetical protein